MSSPLPQHTPALVALNTYAEPLYHHLGDVCMIGRSLICGVIIQDCTASRLHARIERQDEDFLLVDLGSANGTFVNGRRIVEQHTLRDGDKIGIGAPLASLCFTIAVVLEPSS